MNLFNFISVVNIFLSVFFGIFVFLKNPKGRLNILWFLVTLSVFLWSIGFFCVISTNSNEIAYFYNKILNLGAILIPVLLFNFIYIFIDHKNLFFKVLLYFGYLLCAIFLFILFFYTKYFFIDANGWGNFKHWITAGILYKYFFIYFVLYSFLGFSYLIKEYKNFVKIKKIQAKYFIIASIVGLISGITNFFPQLFNIYPFGHYFVSFYVILMSYSIIKYRFFDIKIVLKKSFYYIMIFIFYFLFFYLILSFLNHVFNIFNFNIQYSIYFYIFLISILNIYPLKEKIYSLFQNLKYNDVPNIKDNLHLIDFDSIILEFIASIKKIDIINNVRIYIRSSKNIFDICYPEGIKNYLNNKLLIDFFARRNGPIIKDEIIFMKQGKNSKDIDDLNLIFDFMKENNFDSIFPIFNDEEISFIMVVNKADNNVFSVEDIDFIEKNISTYKAFINQSIHYNKTMLCINK